MRAVVSIEATRGTIDRPCMIAGEQRPVMMRACAKPVMHEVGAWVRVMIDGEREARDVDVSRLRIDPRCDTCGATDGVTRGPHPYMSEIHGDETPVWMCDGCRTEAAGDV